MLPLYVPWLSDSIKKRGVRYLLHHYLGQFFEEKLTLDQLSIDIYEGKGSITNLALDVNGLNDELDFIPFKFLDGCRIGQISVEVPWNSLITNVCKFELEGAVFVCRLKTSADGNKAHCTESTLLSRSLMTSSMQMASDIVKPKDLQEVFVSPESSMYQSQLDPSALEEMLASTSSDPNEQADPNGQPKLFGGIELFAALIDSVLRRTKLTAHNTLFRIQPQSHDDDDDDDCHRGTSDEESNNSGKTTPSSDRMSHKSTGNDRSASGDEVFGEPTANSETKESEQNKSSSEGTVEFFIKFFRCEEIVDEEALLAKAKAAAENKNDDTSRSKTMVPETITKLLTLEDVEMRIGGLPVSNLIGKHTIMIKFNGKKSEISVFSGSPLLAVISHEQLRTFFNVFDSAKDQDDDCSQADEKNQKVMSSEDYAKIENQLLEAASLRSVQQQVHELGFIRSSNHHDLSSRSGVGGRRWIDSNDTLSNASRGDREPELDYHPPNSSSSGTCVNAKTSLETEPSLDNIEAFSCELKLPGIWLCILRDGESLPPLIKPYADSINSFQTINKYIEDHIKVPHIRFLALKVALDITSAGIEMFLGDLNISEHLQDDSINPTINILHNDMTNFPMSSSRYKALITNNRDITVDLLTKTRIIFDPTMIDRIIYDYKLINLNRPCNKETIMMNHNDSLHNQNYYHDPHRYHHQCSASNSRNSKLDFNLTIRGEQFKVELFCPIPDLTPEAQFKQTQLRPQSFLFDFNNILIKCQSGKLCVSARELIAYVKTQPKQSDDEAIKFIESISKNNNRISLTLEPSPSNLDTEFPNDIERALNESSMLDSIYVGQATESRIPTEAFQTKRKVVRSSSAANNATGLKQETGKINDCDNEKIITPGDRQHLLDYLNQTVSSTRLSLSLHLPVCEVEFEDKEQLDLIYNRFGNDFVFWQPKAFASNSAVDARDCNSERKQSQSRKFSNATDHSKTHSYSSNIPFFRRPNTADDANSNASDQDSEVSYHSLSVDGESTLDYYDNELTCKITVDEFYVKFNHQSCAAALRQEITAENLLLGVVIDVNKKPGTIISLVADNLELSTDSETVLEGNCYGDNNSVFGLTARIKRPTKSLKDIKLAIQLVNGLFTDFKTEIYTRFWQSINVTDEPILGFIAPKIVTELHIDILNTALSIVRDGARPALLSIDELYLTSMVMEQTSQVMIRLIADEVSLNLKRSKQGLEVMKNYICLIDSGLIDLDVKFSQDGRLEFGVINNVITVRACQDSLNALCKLFKVMFKNPDGTNKQVISSEIKPEMSSNNNSSTGGYFDGRADSGGSLASSSLSASGEDADYPINQTGQTGETNHQSSMQEREMNLLEDAMNNFSDDSSSSSSSSSSIANNNNNEQVVANDDDDFSEEDEDSDSPPGIQTTIPSQASRRDPNACLLDESIPLIGDFFSEPLVPASNDKMNDSSSSFVSSATNGGVDESGFFVIGDDDVGAGIIDKSQQEPVVRKLIEGPINIMDNHFKMTKPRTIPEMLAASLERYVLEEMTLVVNLYGGHDFDDEDDDEEESATNSTTNEEQDAELLDCSGMNNLTIRSRAGSVASAKKSPMNRRHYSSDITALKKKSSGRRKHLSESSRDTYSRGYNPPSGESSSLEQRVRFGEGAVNLWESLDLMSSPDFFGLKRPSQPPLSSDTKIAGGTWRQTDVCIQLTLTKVKLLYEIGDETSPISWRFMLFIHDIEIKDRIHASDINKMLYEYCTESMPRRNTQMLTVKNIATINPSDGCEECDLRVSLKPLRLNIDQDTLLFLIEFFTSFGKALTKQQSVYGGSSSSGVSSGASNRPSATTTKLDRGSGSGSSGSVSAGKLRDFSQSTPTRPDGNESAAHQQRQRGAQQSQGIEIRNRRQQQQASDQSNDTSPSFGSYSSTASTSSACPPTGGGRGGCGGSASSSYNAAASTTGKQGQKQQQHQHQQQQQRAAKTARTGLLSAKTTITNTTTTRQPTISSGGVRGGDDSNGLPTHCHTDSLSGGQQQPIYIKSFTFSPDVPIRLDYHAKHLDFEQGALAGMLMGLAHLDHSELVLRRVQAKHGMRGLDRVLLFTLNSWMSDIKRNQLPSILSGVGPMHSVIQLFQGMRDLIWMPIDHYRKDRRLVRGLQRGASSFSSSTAMAAINLMNRFISIVQCTAQIAHDIVTPSALQSTSSRRVAGLATNDDDDDIACNSSHRYYSHHRRQQSSPNSGGAGAIGGGRRRASSLHLASGGGGAAGGPSGSGRRIRHHTTGHHHHHHHHRGHHHTCTGGGPSSTIAALNQPRNFCEGVAVGFTILKEGFNDTARNVAVGMQAEDVRSAVGELVRQIPSTLLNPIISATEGAQNVLVGIRNQIAPDARREDQEKWKRRVRGK